MPGIDSSKILLTKTKTRRYVCIRAHVNKVMKAVKDIAGNRCRLRYRCSRVSTAAAIFVFKNTILKVFTAAGNTLALSACTTN